MTGRINQWQRERLTFVRHTATIAAARCKCFSKKLPEPCVMTWVNECYGDITPIGVRRFCSVEISSPKPPLTVKGNTAPLARSITSLCELRHWSFLRFLLQSC